MTSHNSLFIEKIDKKFINWSDSGIMPIFILNGTKCSRWIGSIVAWRINTSWTMVCQFIVDFVYGRAVLCVRLFVDTTGLYNSHCVFSNNLFRAFLLLLEYERRWRFCPTVRLTSMIAYTHCCGTNVLNNQMMRVQHWTQRSIKNLLDPSEDACSHDACEWQNMLKRWW